MKNNGWLRCFFLLVLLQALLVGRALIWPEQIGAVLPWPASLLNARFIAALYWMGAASALLLLTLPHFGEFGPSTFPYHWIIFYTLDPLAAAVILWRLRGRGPAPSGWNRLARLLIAYAAILGLVGLILLVAPAAATRLWPWNLPPILGQVYSIFFLTFALGGVLAAREPRWTGVWIYVAANLVMLVLIIGVSLYHADRFTAGPATWVWYLPCAAGALAFGAALFRRPRLPIEGQAQL